VPQLGVVYNKTTGEMKSLLGGEVMTPQMMESRYVELGSKERQGQKLSDSEKAFMSSYKSFLLTKPLFQINAATSGGFLGPAGGGAGAGGVAPPAAGGAPPNTANAPGGWTTPEGKTLNDVPTAIRDEVRQVLEYRRADPSITQRGFVGQAINAWVAKMDPQHDSSTFPAKNKILTDYVKSMDSGSLGATNTALGHLQELNEASKALDQNNVPLIHSIASRLGIAAGGDAGTTYNLILNKVGPELTKAYLKSGGTVGERGSNEDDFALSKGAKQIRSNIAEATQLLNSKIEPLKQNWQDTFRPYRAQDEFDNRWLTPRAKQVIADLASQAPTQKKKEGERKPLSSFLQP